MEKLKGKLYIVPTPIGNLEDITLRALRILKEVDLIACEDTRITQKLLNHYEIHTKLFSYHKFSEKQKAQQITEFLNEGKNVALVSDAGTPVISDPGSELIKIAKENDIKIIPLPGASATITALSAIGCEDTTFAFVGFLPKSKNEKEKLLSNYREITTIFYESPNRLLKTLSELEEIFGNITITVARELSKIFEEINTATVKELIEYYTQNILKGEITVIINPVKKEKSIVDDEIMKKIDILKKEGYSSKEISKIISLLYDIPKNKLYPLLHKTLIEKR
ncbi:MAG: 16S rRNA (cytidine(1402)-2'-O)-methyltransferase [Candidatus Gastranaerophilaceae bacterium]|jgi:16S rRNA (cytidine1402-2'-O)-methyltransferase